MTAVLDSERQIAPGGRRTSTLDSLTVVFSEDLNVVGGAVGANSVLNLANWRLTKDGVDVSNQIASVTFDCNELTNKYEAELNFVTTLTAGTWRLTALAAIRAIPGNSLDGDLNGTPGGDYNHVFAISNILAVGNETRVNTFTTDNHRDSSVAMDVNGDYVVTWQSYTQDGSLSGIYAQRYNAAGVTQGSEFKVNTFTLGNQTKPSVAMDADGDFVVTWQSYTQDGDVNGIYAQRYRSDASVQLAHGGVLTVDGTNLADSISLERVTPAGAALQLNVVRNGVNYSLDASKVLVISVNGQSGDDTLSIGSTIITGAIINGGGGNDVLLGGAQNDAYIFDTDTALGSDMITDIGGGLDTLDFSETTTLGVTVNLGLVGSQPVNANPNLNLSSAVTIENVIGGSLGDTLTRNTLNNSLTGGPGSDTLVGAAGNDTYLFNSDLILGSDTIDESGGGTDTLDFSATITKGIVVNLSNAAAQVVTAGRLTLTLSAGNTIEAVIGGELADSLTGNTLNNSLTGGGGNDTLTGSSGNDFYLFDTDLALGTATINEAGGGIDTLNFTLTSTVAVTVDLSLATVQIINTNLSLNLQSATTIENVIGGSMNDTMKGNSLANTLTGSTGKDWYFRNTSGAVALQRDSTVDADLDSVFEEISTWL